MSARAILNSQETDYPNKKLIGDSFLFHVAHSSSDVANAQAIRLRIRFVCMCSERFVSLEKVSIWFVIDKRKKSRS